jgi:hypothetical protein
MIPNRISSFPVPPLLSKRMQLVSFVNVAT